jgi:glutamate carboxypeptidase
MREIVAQSLPETHATISFDDGYPSMPRPNNPVERGAGDISFVAALVGGSLDGLGPDGEGDHSPREYVSLGSLVPQTQRAAVLIARLAAEHGAPAAPR